MDPNLYLTASLKSSHWGTPINRILAAAIQEVDPAACVQRHVTIVRPIDADPFLVVGGEIYPLPQGRRVWVVGAGKAGAPMAASVAEILGDHLAGGVVIVKDGNAANTKMTTGLEILEAGHPLPDERGVTGAVRIAQLLSELRSEDLVIALISGGGSALLASPVERVSLEEFQTLTNLLLACGATINEINTLRKHLETLKGGGLARLAAPAQLVALILSDVIGDRLEVIASGPTVPDPTTFADAWAVMVRYVILDQVPKNILTHLKCGLRGEIPDTPKPADILFDRVKNLIIGSNFQAAQSAARQAELEGFQSMLLTNRLQGEARAAGRALAALAPQISGRATRPGSPLCLIAGGETTVTLHGLGIGGRNQELALSSVSDLAGLPAILVTLATDGGDGPTDAAGAVVTGTTHSRALRAGMDPSAYLDANDSYHFFECLGDLLKPGPTQTNVNDLNFLFCF